MVRTVESIEDEDRGWGVRKSPYEYDGSPSRALPGNNPVNDAGSSYRDGLSRQQRKYEPIPSRRPPAEPPYKSPKSVTRKIKPERGFGDIPDIPEVDEASDHLVPIGDSGIYATPDEAAEPNDCERWPNSPACGKNPFTNVPIGFEDATIVKDVCNAGFKITPVLGFTKLPDIEVVYRKPECRINPPDHSQRTEWDIYELPPEYQGIPMPPRPRSCIPTGDDFYCFVGVQVHKRDLFKSVNIAADFGDEFIQTASKTTPKLYPPMDGVPVTFSDRTNPQYTYQKIPYITCKYESAFESQGYHAGTGGAKRFINHPSGQKTTHSNYKRSGRIYADLSIDYIKYDADGEITEGEGSYYRYNYDYNVRIWGHGGDSYINSFIVHGLYSDIRKYLEFISKPYINYESYSSRPGQRKESRTRSDFGVQVAWINVDGVTVIPPPCVDKPPEKNKKRCCMGCCPPSPGDDSLLKLILKKVNEIDEDVEKLKKQIGEPVEIPYHVEKQTEKLKDFGFIATAKAVRT